MKKVSLVLVVAIASSTFATNVTAQSCVEGVRSLIEKWGDSGDSKGWPKGENWYTGKNGGGKDFKDLGERNGHTVDHSADGCSNNTPCVLVYPTDYGNGTGINTTYGHVAALYSSKSPYDLEDSGDGIGGVCGSTSLATCKKPVNLTKAFVIHPKPLQTLKTRYFFEKVVASCPSSLSDQQTANCSVRGYYGDNTNKPLTGTWSVDNSAAAGITSSGTLTAKSVSSTTPVRVKVTYAYVNDLVAYATVNIQPSKPSTPYSLRIVSPTRNSVTLTWNDTRNESEFRIYRDGKYLRTVKSNVTSYTDSGLAPRTTYTYAVSAYNTAGESAKSGSASGSTTR